MYKEKNIGDLTTFLYILFRKMCLIMYSIIFTIMINKWNYVRSQKLYQYMIYYTSINDIIGVKRDILGWN